MLLMRRGADEHDLRRVHRRGAGRRVDRAHAGGALAAGVVDHVGHDLERLERQTSRGGGGRQRGRLRAEIGAVRAAEPAGVAILASPAAGQRPRQVGDAAGNDPAAAAELFRQAPGDQIFRAVERHRRLKLPVGKLRQSFGRSGDAHEALDVVVPGREVRVPDRPVDRDPLFRVRLEIQIAQPVTLPPPGERAATHVIPAVPVKPLDLGVGRFLLVHPPVEVLFVEGVVALEDRIRFFHRVGAAAAMRVFPRRLARVGVALDVFDVPATFEHEHAETALGEFLGRPPARDAGADNDRVKRFGLWLHLALPCVNVRARKHDAWHRAIVILDASYSLRISPHLPRREIDRRHVNHSQTNSVNRSRAPGINQNSG